MGWWNRIPQFCRYALVIGLSLLVSAGGVGWAVHKGCWSEGGRGGAFATMIAFIVLFLRPDYGMQIYEERKARIKADLPKLEQLEARHEALVSALKINSSGQAHQNRALVIASLIGTLFWGFGDWIAKTILHQ